ncbi:MAG: YtxH domain-containing protein [Bacteroidetes bacterium]|nr:MAG: YtxH domain-containing protein [Bacteroidota bacterium]
MKADSRALLGFLAGAAVGALAGILFAPDSGTETRKKISKKTGEVGDQLKQKFNEFVDGVKEKYAGVKDQAEDVAEKGISKFNSLKNETRNTLPS